MISSHTSILYLVKNGEQEIIHMMDVVSTNKTDFFREPTHFEFMEEVILPEIYANKQSEIKIWSAGSSSGEEAYTITMVMEEYIAKTWTYKLSNIRSRYIN
jgi:chemotaxis protein methyltransferase CheR